MKLYVLMTSLTLAVGVSLGYWTGQESARTGFAKGCAATGFAVVYDNQRKEKRYFHCFELELQEPPEPRDAPDAGNFVVL